MDRDHLLARLAASQHGVFSRLQALALGFTEDAIDRRLRSRRWVRVHSGVYAIAGTPASPSQTLMAACLAAGDGALVSHLSAAALFGLDCSVPRPQLTVPVTAKPRVDGVQVFRSRDLLETDRCRVDQIPTTRLPRVFLDLAAVLDPRALEQMLDEALATRRMPLRHLERRLAETRGGHDGVSLLRALVAERLGETHPLNGFERDIVKLLTSHGMAPTATQYPLVMPSGRRIRLDAAYPERRFGVEGQSYRHHSAKQPWRADQGRYAELHAIGWHVLPVTPEDLDERPLWIVGQVALGLSGEASVG